MTAYIVAVGETGAYEKPLTAGVEDTVTFGGGDGDPEQTDLSHVEVFHHSGTKPLYVRFGAAATVRGAPSKIVPVGTWANLEPRTPGDTVVHVISEADAVYSVADGG